MNIEGKSLSEKSRWNFPRFSRTSINNLYTE